MRAPPLLLALGLLACPAAAQERFAIVVGANLGWAADQPLRYAERDARRMAAVLTELGDYRPQEVLFLQSPSGDELRRYFAELKARQQAVLEEGQEPTGTFLFYYSGHADARHLHLSGEPVAMPELLELLRGLPFAVKVGILDACHSGSILSTKGGRPAPLFEVRVQDELEVRGTALLTSSGADEFSQESRAFTGSFFTHHLVSGLRGAADEDADGRISLNEAFRYASTRTTLDTADTPTGVQRPAYSFELKGRGEVYLTRLQGELGHSRITFRKPGQRCFITDGGERLLVAEAVAAPQAPAVLALPPGEYRVKCRDDEKLMVAELRLGRDGAVDAGKLRYKRQPLSVALLKGAAGRERTLEEHRQRGYELLRMGKPEEALSAFEEALRLDLGDGRAYRGKAQVFLAMAKQASEQKQGAQVQGYVSAALRVEPALSADPGVDAGQLALRDARLPESAREKKTETPPSIAKPAPSPSGTWVPKTKRFALGISLTDGQGLLGIHGEVVFFKQLHLGVHVTPIAIGFGAAARWVPWSSDWSPYVGLGVHGSLWGLGVLERSAQEPEYKIGEAVFARRSDFDRVVYAEAGLIGFSWSAQLDFGLAVQYSAPPGRAGFFRLMPALSLKYVFKR